MATDKTTNILQLKKLVQKFIEDRDWSKYHNPKDIAISITIEASELLELFQWVKENELDKLIENPKKLVAFEGSLMRSVLVVVIA